MSRCHTREWAKHSIYSTSTVSVEDRDSVGHHRAVISRLVCSFLSIQHFKYLNRSTCSGILLFILHGLRTMLLFRTDSVLVFLMFIFIPNSKNADFTLSMRLSILTSESDIKTASLAHFLLLIFTPFEILSSALPNRSSEVSLNSISDNTHFLVTPLRILLEIEIFLLNNFIMLGKCCLS